MAPKLVVKVANDQRISTHKIVRPPIFTIDGDELLGLKFKSFTSLEKSRYYIGITSL